jgi:hypothetical protein
VTAIARRHADGAVRLAATAVGGLAVALGLLLGGCSDPNPNGPFGDSPQGSVGGQCAWYPKGSVATLGMLSFSNSGGLARIDRVTLVDAHHLRVVAEWVVRITGHDLIGVMGGYPPLGAKGQGPGFLASGIDWAGRQPAVGATIVHTPFPDVINPVLVLKATGVKGTAKDVYIDYESGDRRYRRYFGVSILLYNNNPRGCLTGG